MERRQTLGVNLWCPECGTIVATEEGATLPWCVRCAKWLCGEACWKRHHHRGRR